MAILFYTNGEIKDRLWSRTAIIKRQIPVVYITRQSTDTILAAGNVEATLNIPPSQEIKASNVIGYIDNKADKTVIIGGHFDHVGKGFYSSHTKGDTAIHNGADDNASGTATVLELARWIKHQNFKNFNYMFVAFSAEERGLIGSEFLAHSSLVEPKKIHYMLNYDMVGRMRKLRDKLFVLGLGSAQEIENAIKSTRYKGKLKKHYGTHQGSDHYHFENQGIPFLYFTSGLHWDYHKPSDDFELINFDGMVKTIEYSKKVIKLLEETETINYRKSREMKIREFIPMFLQ